MNPSHPSLSRIRAWTALCASALATAAMATTPPSASPAKPAAIASQAKPASSAPAAAPAAAEKNVVYKWKDAHGVSQYSQQPPPKGVKFEVIQNASAPPQSSNPMPLSGQN